MSAVQKKKKLVHMSVSICNFNFKRVGDVLKANLQSSKKEKQELVIVANSYEVFETKIESTP